MRKKLVVLFWFVFAFVVGFALEPPPASASSLFLDYTGTVASDVTFSPLAPGIPFTFNSVFGQQLAGKPFTINETFSLSKADFVLGATYIGSLGNDSFASASITIGNVTAALNGNFGTFTPVLGGFSTEIGTKAGPLAPFFAILSYSSGFTLAGFGTPGNFDMNSQLLLTDGPFTRTLTFDVTSQTVSAVPLPPALPLFACAMAALVFAASRQRWRDRVSHNGDAAFC